MKDVLMVVWSDKQATGIPIIDEQHRIIAGLINLLFFLLSRNLFKDSIVNIAKVILHYIRLHNFTEEYILREAGYPELEEHRLLHKDAELELTLAIKKTLEAYENNARRSEELMAYMKNYWLVHTCKEDRKYISHLAETL